MIVTVTAESPIAAPADRVFAALVDIERFPETSPDCVSIRFLTEQKTGAGTRFVETRRAGKKTQDFELELTECDPAARTARFVNETHGTLWDTTMRVTEAGAGSHVTFAMDAHTDSYVQRVIFGLMKGVFRKAMNKQVRALKEWCEAQG